ncbi:uncharacterized protein CIMG_13431 [Coccidioides immitis RS]|uniref:Uncharacterized protein n=1 Tax=Coccidioides immitis (strain RS) TaxID=246410 RepID=J3KF14_COCIM|nr:uncharacterized protein CIMG_13431 [Coccidioides immitis RS]EAS34159.3 hypothetical protein CIMG_13431 [Coccidioides immitis RS]
MNVSDSRAKLCRIFLNVYKLLDDLVGLDFVKDTGNGNECASQYSNIRTLNDSTLRLVDIKNINLKHIHNLTNKISDVDEDNGDNRNNRADKDNRDNRDDEDNEDNEKSSSHVLENTECEKARK